MKRPTITQAVGAVVAALGLMFASLLLVVPRVTETVPLVVLTGSMTPTYPAGSMVFVETVPPTDIAVGDVITFQGSTSTSLTSHRVVEIEHDDGGDPVFTTRGDANEVPDREPVTVDRFRGRVRFGIPWIGHARNFVASPVGLAILALLVGTILLVDHLRSGRTPDAPATTRPRPRRAAPWARATAPRQDGVAPPSVGPSTARARTVEQQLLLARVGVGHLQRDEVLRAADLLDARVLTLAHDELVLAFVGDVARLDDVTAFLRAYDLLETARTSVARLGESPVDAPAPATPGAHMLEAARPAATSTVQP